MIVFPNCKINLGLYIGPKRADGFHSLQTVFYPIPLTDALELLTADEKRTELSLSGLPIDGPTTSLSPYQAWELLRNDFPELPQVKIHLHKVIPSGAGLGGGSADGAFALSLIDKKFKLGLTMMQLEDYAARLGSDCPFFIRSQPAYAEGRGEQLEPLPLDLSGYVLVLVNPGIHVNTGWAFGQVDKRSEPVDLRAQIAKPVSEWPSLLQNDFETTIFEAHPEIGTIKSQLYAAGALYASMSGSGSTVFGLFAAGAAPTLAFPECFFVRSLVL